MIEVSHISKCYGKGEFFSTALDDISLKVEKGEQIAIIGKSGSGKSTLLNIIGGMDTPSKGEIKINGSSLKKSEKQLAKYRRSQVGYVFQFFYLIPSLSIADNIMLPLHINHKKVDKIVHFFRQKRET